jgi:hypothetical protein
MTKQDAKRIAMGWRGGRVVFSRLQISSGKVSFSATTPNLFEYVSQRAAI